MVGRLPNQVEKLRVTLTIPDDLEARLEAYLTMRGVPPTTVLEDALRAYLEDKGKVLYLDGKAYPVPERPLRFTPAERGSGKRDVSINHDKYLLTSPL
jgi:hypothetical protein